MKEFFILKKSGEKELFSIEKLKKSLQRSGAMNEHIKKVIEDIKPQLYDGISTKKIYKKAFTALKKTNRTSASKYSLKRALFKLGPSGYPFERLVGALLKHKGYKTRVGVILQGECVTHEIDVLAEKEGNSYAVECKFHLKSNYSNNVKTPLYINSRFIDIQKKWNSNPQITTILKQGWLVTNTRFSLDAIKYSECIGLRLLSWDYPKNNGIEKNINEFGLYPITVLTTISKREMEQIIANDIILIKELMNAPEILNKIKISSDRIPLILSELEHLI